MPEVEPEDDVTSRQAVADAAVREAHVSDGRASVQCDEDRMLINVEQVVDAQPEAHPLPRAVAQISVEEPERVLAVDEGAERFTLGDEQVLLGVVVGRSVECPAQLSAPVSFVLVRDLAARLFYAGVRDGHFFEDGRLVLQFALCLPFVGFVLLRLQGKRRSCA